MSQSRVIKSGPGLCLLRAGRLRQSKSPVPASLHLLGRRPCGRLSKRIPQSRRQPRKPSQLLKRRSRQRSPRRASRTNGGRRVKQSQKLPPEECLRLSSRSKPGSRGSRRNSRNPQQLAKLQKQSPRRRRLSQSQDKKKTHRKQRLTTSLQSLPLLPHAHSGQALHQVRYQRCGLNDWSDISLIYSSHLINVQKPGVRLPKVLS